MRSKSPMPQPVKTFAFTVGGNGRTYAVRFAGGIHCPHCVRQLHATDIEVDDFDMRLLCSGCARELLAVEAQSPVEVAP